MRLIQPQTDSLEVAVIIHKMIQNEKLHYRNVIDGIKTSF